MVTADTPVYALRGRPDVSVGLASLLRSDPDKVLSRTGYGSTSGAWVGRETSDTGLYTLTVSLYRLLRPVPNPNM